MPLQPSVHGFEIKHFLSEFRFNVLQCNTLVRQQGSKAICICNSMICSDIWHKFQERYFEMLHLIFTSR